MSAQVLFNPLTYIDRLTRGGFTPDQARASAEALETAFSESVATKSDIAELKRDIADVKRDVTDVDTRLRAEISKAEAKLKLELSEAEGRLRHEISAAKHETLRWVFAFNLGLIGAVFTIANFLK